MNKIPRAYVWTLAGLWLVGIVVARFYTQQQHIPTSIAIASGLALLIELSLYLGLAFEPVRMNFPVLASVVSGPAIYAIYSVPAGVFSPRSCAGLIAGALLLARWFRDRKPSVWRDLAFILLLAVPLIFKLFPQIYARPYPDLRLEILGQLFWIRMGLLVIFQLRPEPGMIFGFWPSREEWRTGVLWFLLLVPVAAVLGPLTGFAHFQSPVLVWWQTAALAAGTFFGILWVVALSEEFIFRGLLQQWFEKWTGSAAAALVAASVLFGSVHLGYRQFPNWRFAIVAGVAGLFYGMAFRRGGSIRAAMVTHALTVTVWKTLFR